MVEPLLTITLLPIGILRHR